MITKQQFEEISEEFYELLRMHEELRVEAISSISPYSPLINSRVHTSKEIEIYKALGLQETFVTRTVLVASIDIFYTNYSTGKTNYERMLQGQPPYCYKTGQVYDIHHIGQEFDGPFAELPHLVHTGTGNFEIFHDFTVESWRLDAKKLAEFNREKEEHWKRRAKELYESVRV